jgi:hypothetical protein
MKHLSARARAIAVGLSVGFALLLGYCVHRPSPLAPPLGFAPISSQGAAATTSFAGVIDPTSPTGWLGTIGMTACSASCSGSLANQNRTALQTTIAYAAAHNKAVYVPPGRYPLTCTPSAAYAIDLNGDSYLTILAYGATFMLQGDQSGGTCSMFWVRNAVHVRFVGATFSARDATNSTTSTNLLKIGDGGTTSVDDVQLQDVTFTEGSSGAGDCVLMDGGTVATVTRVTITQNVHFDGAAPSSACQQAAIHIKTGVQQVEISHSWFANNNGRDIWVDSTADGVVGRIVILNNAFERNASAGTVTSVELNGYGGTNDADSITFKYNKVLGGIVKASNLTRSHFTANPAITFNGSSASSVVDLAGRITEVWVEDNYLSRGTSATNGSLVSVTGDGTTTPSNVWITGNRMRQYSGAAPAVSLTGLISGHVIDNDITYHAVTADSGGTGFAGSTAPERRAPAAARSRETRSSVTTRTSRLRSTSRRRPRTTTR